MIADRLVDSLTIREIDLRSAENNINPRLVSAEVCERIDQRCRANAPLQLGANVKRWGKGEEFESPLQLGAYLLHRWSPPDVELRSSKTVAQKYKPALATALAAGDVQAVQAAIAGIYVGGYDSTGPEGSGGDTSDTGGGRLGALLAGVASFAASLIAYVGNNATNEDGTPDVTTSPDYVADYTSESVASQGATAGVLDTAEQAGNKVRFVLDSDDACEQCQDAHDGSPYDVDDAPELPIHPHCLCTIEPVGAS
jgi:hypothetical protein